MVDAEYGPQFLLGALLRPVDPSVHRMILNIGLCQAEVQVPGHDGIQVKCRSHCGFNCGPDRVFRAPVIDHFCNGQAGGEINSGNISAADGDKNFFGLKLVRDGAENSARNKAGG